jgi:hypothetical protein
MKKIAIVILIIMNTSFNEVPKKYWMGVSVFIETTSNLRIRTVFAKVICADNKSKAEKLYNAYIKSRGIVNYFQEGYAVYEIKQEDILK